MVDSARTCCTHLTAIPGKQSNTPFALCLPPSTTAENHLQERAPSPVRILHFTFCMLHFALAHVPVMSANQNIFRRTIANDIDFRKSDGIIMVIGREQGNISGDGSGMVRTDRSDPTDPHLRLYVTRFSTRAAIAGGTTPDIAYFSMLDIGLPHHSWCGRKTHFCRTKPFFTLKRHELHPISSPIPTQYKTIQSHFNPNRNHAGMTQACAPPWASPIQGRDLLPVARPLDACARMADNLLVICLKWIVVKAIGSARPSPSKEGGNFNRWRLRTGLMRIAKVTLSTRAIRHPLSAIF